MKKSELKEYIRETIISELTPQDQAANNAAKAAIDDTVKDLTTKSAQTTDPEDKKAALAALTAAKTKQVGINKAIQSKQSVAVGMLPENEEDFDKEPSLSDLDSDIDDNSSMSALKSRYDGIVKLMQSIANKWKNADEPEKSKHLAKLKKLTNIKNELTSMMNPSLDDEDEI
jgi:hypothetical protein